VVQHQRSGHGTRRAVSIVHRLIVQIPNAWVALGGNLGDVRAAFGRAAALLVAQGEAIISRSSLYLTPPLGPPQPDYVNAVISLSTTRDARGLLSVLVDIEDQLGRQRTEHWGPRTLDLDLLFFGPRAETVWREGSLVLPHPEIERRAFVLAPLAEIAPDLRHPLLGRTVRELLSSLPDGDQKLVRRLDIGWVDG
jgi:2-amino-4-hydroxy-6-hydroxymethyldihydropteridine diphosphokinase